MIDSPTIDIQELRSVLTDAGHTAVGLATMAAKKANDVRLDLTDRYDDQTKDLRSNLLTVVQKFDGARSKVEARVEPVIESIAARLPAPARRVVENLTESAKEAQAKAHKRVVDALTVETVQPAVKTATPSTKRVATRKVATKKVVTETVVAEKVAPRKVAVRKVAVKNSAAKNSAVKNSAAKKVAPEKVASAKPAARKATARKATARKVATA